MSSHYKSTAKLYRKNETTKYLCMIIDDLFFNFSTFAAKIQQTSSIMSYSNTSRPLTDTKVLILFTLWSFVIQLFLSNDSPFFGLAHHLDSAWFFMEGKAFFYGMRPYVEFTDFKGPIIWLFYGIGWLISPLNYHGMYVVSGVFYALTLFFNYKTAKIFLKSDGRSLAATLPMIFVYFFPWFHFETRSEDLMLLFVAISLYALFKRLYAEERHDVADFMMLGGCFTVLVLMKYNIAAVQGIMVLVALWDQYKNKRGLAKPFLWMIVISVLIAAPFIIYFIMTDTLGAFFHNYFVLAYETVMLEDSDSPSYMQDLAGVLADYRKIVFIVAVFVSGMLLSLKLKKYKYVPVAIGLIFIAMSTRHNVWNYYYGVCYIFVLYLFIDVLLIMNQRVRLIGYGLLASYITLYCVYGNLMGGELRQNTIFTHNEDRESFQAISDVMKDVKNPRLLSYACQEFGFGVMYHALPAGDQFAYPNGGTPPMIRDHKKILTDRKADFVVTYCKDDDTEKFQVLRDIEAAGYELRLKRTYMNLPFYIYEKKK